MPPIWETTGPTETLGGGAPWSSYLCTDFKITGLKYALDPSNVRVENLPSEVIDLSPLISLWRAEPRERHW